MFGGWADLESFLHDALEVAIVALLLACTGLWAVGNGVLVKVATDCNVSCFVELVRRAERLVDSLSHELLVGRATTTRVNTDPTRRH